MAEKTIKKADLLTFGQYRIGGVQTFYKLLFSCSKKSDFNSKIIFYDKRNELTPTLTEEWTQCNYKVFRFNPDSEEEYIYRNRLAHLMKNNKGCIVTNFALELKSITSEIFKNNVIFHICHDDDYLSIAKDFCNRIDAFICHNPVFKEKLIELLPERENDVYYLPYGIIPSVQKNTNSNKKLKLVYFSRFDESKGIQNIPLIEEKLRYKNIEVDWLLMGDGPLKNQIIENISKYDNFEYSKPKNDQEIYNSLVKCDLFILPSYKDGLPIAMLESMSTGSVPIVFNFNKGIRDILGDCGFVVNTDDIEGITNQISLLDSNRDQLTELKRKCITKIDTDYHFELNGQKYFELFSKYEKLKRKDLRIKDNMENLHKSFKIGLISKLKTCLTIS